jgi:hypothetical protein
MASPHSEVASHEDPICGERAAVREKALLAEYWLHQGGSEGTSGWRLWRISRTRSVPIPNERTRVPPATPG